jgi:hypothetical protein
MGFLETTWSGSPSARAIIKSLCGSPAVFDDGQWHQPTSYRHGLAAGTYRVRSKPRTLSE